jgi:hypothetical protein
MPGRKRVFATRKCASLRHDWIPENIHVRPNGHRRCLLCDKEYDAIRPPRRRDRRAV